MARLLHHVSGLLDSDRRCDGGRRHGVSGGRGGRHDSRSGINWLPKSDISQSGARSLECPISP